MARLSGPRVAALDVCAMTSRSDGPQAELRTLSGAVDEARERYENDPKIWAQATATAHLLSIASGHTMGEHELNIARAAASVAWVLAEGAYFGFPEGALDGR